MTQDSEEGALPHWCWYLRAQVMGLLPEVLKEAGNSNQLEPKLLPVERSLLGQYWQKKGANTKSKSFSPPCNTRSPCSVTNWQRRRVVSRGPGPAQHSRGQECVFAAEREWHPTQPKWVMCQHQCKRFGVRKVFITIIMSAAITEHLLYDIPCVPSFPHTDSLSPHNLSGRYYCLTNFTGAEAIFREGPFKRLGRGGTTIQNEVCLDARTPP